MHSIHVGVVKLGRHDKIVLGPGAVDLNVSGHAGWIPASPAQWSNTIKIKYSKNILINIKCFY